MAERDRYTGYGMPEVNFDILGNLGDTYTKAKNERTLSELGKGLASGQIDYRTAAGMAAEAGQPAYSLSLLKLGESAADRTKTDAQQADLLRMIQGRFGNPDPSTQPTQAAPVQSPATAPPAPAPVLRQRQTVAPGSPNERVASAFDAAQGAIDTGVLDPQGENGQGIPTNAQAAQYVVPGPQGLAPQSPTAPPVAKMQPPIGAGPQPTPRTNPLQNDIPALIALSMHPGASKGQQETFKVLLQEAIKNPDNLREYDFYQKQTRANGGQPLPVLDYFMQKASAGTQGRAQTAFDVSIDQAAAKRFEKDLEAGDQAKTRMVDINNMREIGLRVGSQGATAAVKEALGPYATALGIDVNNLSDIQAYSSIIQRLAPTMRVTGSGSTSDIEFKGMIKALPTLIQNPEAREMTLDTLQAMNQYDMARASIASRLVSREITHADAEKERRALPDPMTAFREWRKSHPQEFGAALKEGAGASPGQPSPAAIEQEMRRRGLIQ